MTSPGAEVHVTIDALVVHGVSREETRDLIAALQSGLEARWGASASWTARPVSAAGPSGSRPGASRAKALGEAAAHRIADAVRP